MKTRSLLSKALYVTGAVVIGQTFAPALKKVVRPLLVSALGGALVLSDQARTWTATAREEVEDLLAEARYRKQLTDEATESSTESERTLPTGESKITATDSVATAYSARTDWRRLAP